MTTGPVPTGLADYSFDTLPTSAQLAAKLDVDRVTLEHKGRIVQVSYDASAEAVYAEEVEWTTTNDGSFDGWDPADSSDGLPVFESVTQSWEHERGAADGDWQTEDHALECLADEILEFWRSLP